ncbi:MAG: GerMN domain-containing protein [Firmicutes bacterium]|nr:GerMN domain-containing protein [Bacillota bacterium]
MKFPVTIVLLLIITAIIGMVAINYNTNYMMLQPDQYISPEHGSIKINSKLYFVYDNALRTETRTITVKDANFSKAIIESISYGSRNDYFKSIFDFGVQINSIDLINETCYINFSDSPQLNLLLGHADLDLYLWSLVNSLTDNNQIKNVQFLIEGKQFSRRLHGYNINAPLTKMDALVYQKEISSSDVVLEFVEYVNTLRYDLAYSLLTKNSMNNYDYSAFIKYANAFNESHNGYNLDAHYTRIYSTYDEVFLKFTKEYASDGFILNMTDKWVVIQEDDVYRISLNAN